MAERLDRKYILPQVVKPHPDGKGALVVGKIDGELDRRTGGHFPKIGQVAIPVPPEDVEAMNLLAYRYGIPVSHVDPKEGVVVTAYGGGRKLPIPDTGLESIWTEVVLSAVPPEKLRLVRDEALP